MTSKQRMLIALDGGIPDRLPVTTHFLMPQFLNTCMGGMSEDAFFDTCGWDPITYTTPHRPDPTHGEYYDPDQGTPGFLESRRIASDNWRVQCEATAGREHPATRYRFVTPKGALSMVLESDPFTAWVVEPLVKEKRDIDLIAEYATAPKCDVAAVNQVAEAFGQRGLVRGYICCFDVFGQPGTWQDATCLVGVERLIMETYDDPVWVHELLGSLFRRKKAFVESLAGPATTFSNWAGACLVDGDFTAVVRGVRGPLRQPTDCPGAPCWSANCLPYLRRNDADPGTDCGHEAQRHGDFHPARHGRRHGSGRGASANPPRYLHDRRVRPVPFLQGVYAGRDASRSTPLFQCGRQKRRVYSLPLG